MLWGPASCIVKGSLLHEYHHIMNYMWLYFRRSLPLGRFLAFLNAWHLKFLVLSLVVINFDILIVYGRWFWHVRMIDAFFEFFYYVTLRCRWFQFCFICKLMKTWQYLPVGLHLWIRPNLTDSNRSSCRTWNCGLTSPVSRLKTRDTLRACLGLKPKLIPILDLGSHFPIFDPACNLLLSA